MSPMLHEDRCFGPDARQIEVARELYRGARDLPLVCPHGHVDPRLFTDPDYHFGTPVDLLLIPDHYVFRMLYSQGVALEDLGIPRVDGGPVETDHRKIWQTFAEHYYLFRGTPTGLWLDQELAEVFGITGRLDGDSAQQIYDQIAEKLESPELRPRRLFERFNVRCCARPTLRPIHWSTTGRSARPAGVATSARPSVRMRSSTSTAPAGDRRSTG